MKYAFRNTAIRALLVIAALAFVANMAWSQAGTGELSGVVTDPQGAVVADVPVKLTNSSTGTTRTTTTNSSGFYRFPALPIVGTYTVEAAPSGFRSVKVENVIVTVATVTNRDIKLEVGTTNEQVTVEGNTQQVQTSESAVSQLVDRRVWEQMPLETRTQNEFINLVAGAVPQIFDNTFRGAAVNGTRTGTGNYLVEGVDNNEQGQGGVAIIGGAGGANTSISPDAIQEYRVITHDFNAEYGKAGGFVTDTVLKSGTNQWHGSLFEYNRVQALAANDFFSNRAGIQDSLVRNQFGGSVGGPIIKDKTFFFSSVEFHRRRQSQPLTGVSYTRQFYDFVNSGAFEQFMESAPGGFCQLNLGAACPGGFSGSATVGPIFNAQEQQFPNAVPIVDSTITPAECAAGNPACAGQGVFTGQALFGVGQPIQYPVPLYDTATESDQLPLNQYRVSLKVDHKLTNKDQINGVYLLEDATSSDSLGGGDATFGVPFENPNRAQTLGLTWTHTFSSNVLNQAKAGYTRRVADFTAPGTDGIPSLITIDSLSGGFGGSQGLPQFFTDNDFQYKDDLSITKGNHSLKFGGEYRRTRNGSSFFNDKNGHFWSWGGEDLITDSVFSDEADQLYFGQPYYGTWYSAGAAVNPTNGQLPEFYRGYRANEFGVYAQDDWRIHPRFTLNLGVRWEYFGPPHNFQDGLDSNFYFGPATTPIATTSTNPYFPINNPLYAREATGAFQQRNSDIWAKDYNNFGPRVGFSWDLFGTQKVVLRSGFGMFYDRIYNNIFENIRFNPPGFWRLHRGCSVQRCRRGRSGDPGIVLRAVHCEWPIRGSYPFPAGLPKATPRHMDENLVSPYYEQWSFGLQYDLGHNLILETNYIGTSGRKLMAIRNINTFDGRISGLGSTRINPTIGSVYSAVVTMDPITTQQKCHFASNFLRDDLQRKLHLVEGIGRHQRRFPCQGGCHRSFRSPKHPSRLRSGGFRSPPPFRW